MGERFEPGLNACVFGASGGIGSALVHALARDPSVRGIHAFSRRPVPSTGKVTGLICDPLKDDDLARAAEAAKAAGPQHLVLIATGTLHGETYGPEKAFRDLEEDAFLEVMRINALAPALIARHMAPLLDRERRSVLAALSARVGSISDNRLGGWHSYRASKAALNMLLRGLSIELARRNPNAVVAGLHPGTVDTPLSAPFQRNVPEGKLFATDYVGEALLDVVSRLTPEQTGRVLGYAGKEVPA